MTEIERRTQQVGRRLADAVTANPYLVPLSADGNYVWIEGTGAVRLEQPELDKDDVQQVDLHSTIMNLPCNPHYTVDTNIIAYKQGHRDARHAAAELVMAQQGEARAILAPMGKAGDEWYFDCDGHYIDVKRDVAGKYSIYFRNRTDDNEAWLDQAEQDEAKDAPATPAPGMLSDERETFESSTLKKYVVSKFDKYPSGKYVITWVQEQWEGWQARALLANLEQPAGELPPLPPTDGAVIFSGLAVPVWDAAQMHAYGRACMVLCQSVKPAPATLSDAQIMELYDKAIDAGGSADNIILNMVKYVLAAAGSSSLPTYSVRLEQPEGEPVAAPAVAEGVEASSYEWMAAQQQKGRAVSNAMREAYAEGLLAAALPPI